MKLCKHELHKVIDDILEPKYSTDSVRINVKKVTDKVEHYLIRFVKSTDYPDWFYMSGKLIRKHPVYPNGRGFVYEVPMSKRDTFEPIKNCEHTD
jgi:hypothetical protein